MLIDINNTDNVTLFWYAIIFIGTVYAFSRTDIKLNVVYGTFIVLIILYILNDEYTNTKKTINDILKVKKDSILPQVDRIGNYDDVVNFLFSIQDFYIYNAQAYEDMVQSIDEFFIFYEEVLNNNELAGEHYDVLNDKRRYSLNSLQSMIYNFPANVDYIKKLNKSINILDTLLQKYLNNVKLINDNNIYQNGYHMTTKLITNDNIVPYNTFNKTEVFELY
jgi:hypothetical protein